MKYTKVLGLCFAAILSIAITAATASAHRVWTYEEPAGTQHEFKTNETVGITAKLKAGTTAILNSELLGAKIKVVCKKLTVANDILVNEEEPSGSGKRTGRDKGTVIFEECELEGSTCKLEEPSKKEIRTPNTGEGRSVLVENKTESEVLDDFLPGVEAKGVAAVIHIKKTAGGCPERDEVVNKTIKVIQPGEAKEGEGGVVAKIVPGGAGTAETERVTQVFKFPAEKGCPLHFKNWKLEEIATNEIYDSIEGKLQEKECATFEAEIEASLTGVWAGKEWGTK